MEDQMTRRALVTILALTALGALLAPGSAARAQTPRSLHFVLTPSQKPTDLLAAGEEFGAALARLVGIPIRVTVASDYAAVVEALRNRTADLAFVHPAGYVLANREAKATIVAQDRWHGNTSYRARIFVRKESGLKSLEELRGKTIAFIDPASTSGYVWPMVLLIKRGLVQNKDPKTFFKDALFAGSHDAGLQALLKGHVDALASFDQAREQYLKDPAEREKISWVAETEPIPEGGVCARDGLDPAVVAKVRAALLAMRGPEYEPLLKKLYDIDGFEPADDRIYEPVRAAMDLVGWRPKR
jgi:phosphonate transport system substrate-binding protein